VKDGRALNKTDVGKVLCESMDNYLRRTQESTEPFQKTIIEASTQRLINLKQIKNITQGTCQSTARFDEEITRIRTKIDKIRRTWEINNKKERNEIKEATRMNEEALARKMEQLTQIDYAPSLSSLPPSQKETLLNNLTLSPSSILNSYTSSTRRTMSRNLSTRRTRPKSSLGNFLSPSSPGQNQLRARSVSPAPTLSSVTEPNVPSRCSTPGTSS
jgi:hypothetical protein